MSSTDGLAIAQQTCIDATLRPGRSCDKVADSCDNCSVPRDVTYECLAVSGVVTCHLRPVPVVTVTRTVPLVLGLSLSLFPSVLPPRFRHFLRCPHSSFPRRMELQGDAVVPPQDPHILPDVPLIRFDRDAVMTPLGDTMQYSSALLKVCVFSDHLLT